MIKSSTIKFLKDLKVNNNRPWFEEHRNSFNEAKEDFESFIQQVIDKTALFDPHIIELKAKDCTFRQYRDVRFSKDKRPYKVNMGAYMAKGGKKSLFGGYYFHLEPVKSLVGGGLWMPMPPEMKKVRQEIDYCFPEFKKLISTKIFKNIYKDLEHEGEGIKLKNVPKGYEADNPAVEYLKLKSFFADRPLSDKEILSPSLLKEIIDSFKALKPVVDFINRAVE